jgi:hypothetical protein
VIFKAGKNGQNIHKRRLEDQFQTKYTTIIENVEIEGTLNPTSWSVGAKWPIFIHF